ncbi:aminoglycoside phosphotransferase family protein [Streptomyces sp. Act143]|uniref:aminoglycoside phosphotransferase family protein n=1 Tax=Streptomyces sp. Act143 TaxID=2200760 RepID=UPI00215B5E5A|nr:aminoglycoside phosphotransferase family protein [Streptomyces sp. Act143]
MPSDVEMPAATEQARLFGAGPVPRHGPLDRFLRDRVYGEVLGMSGADLRFVLGPSDNGAMVRCDEVTTSTPVMLKVYGLKWIDGRRWDRPALRADLMRREYDNLRRVQPLGAGRGRHRVVRPFAAAAELGATLAEELVLGPDLLHYIEAAARWSGNGELDARLRQAAEFFADLHTLSATGRPGDGRGALAYLEKVVAQLTDFRILTSAEAAALRSVGRAWEVPGRLGPPDEVLIHGDATPTQFLFPPTGELVAVDFERLQYGDRAADIGRMAGELKHLFRLYTGDPWAGEPHIRHFYAAYLAAAAPAVEADALLDRARFHMACSELRIARNSWVDWDNRRFLVREAAACLAP